MYYKYQTFTGDQIIDADLKVAYGLKPSAHESVIHTLWPMVADLAHWIDPRFIFVSFNADSILVIHNGILIRSFHPFRDTCIKMFFEDEVEKEIYPNLRKYYRKKFFGERQ